MKPSNTKRCRTLLHFYMFLIFRLALLHFILLGFHFVEPELASPSDRRVSGGANDLRRAMPGL